MKPGMGVVREVRVRILMFTPNETMGRREVEKEDVASRVFGGTTCYCWHTADACVDLFGVR